MCEDLLGQRTTSEVKTIDLNMNLEREKERVRGRKPMDYWWHINEANGGSLLGMVIYLLKMNIYKWQWKEYCFRWNYWVWSGDYWQAYQQHLITSLRWLFSLATCNTYVCRATDIVTCVTCHLSKNVIIEILDIYSNQIYIPSFLCIAVFTSKCRLIRF